MRKTNDWEQRADESAQAFAAFTLYRDLKPTERTLEKAYHVYLRGKRGGLLSGINKKLPGRWQVWSSDYEWQSRARAFDIHNQRRELIKVANKRQREIEAFIKADMNLSIGFQRIAGAQLAEYIKAPTTAEPGQLRQLALTYDTSRKWLSELIGLFDDEAKPLSDLAASDEALAEEAVHES